MWVGENDSKNVSLGDGVCGVSLLESLQKWITELRPQATHF